MSSAPNLKVSGSNLSKDFKIFELEMMRDLWFYKHTLYCLCIFVTRDLGCTTKLAELQAASSNPISSRVRCGRIQKKIRRIFWSKVSLDPSWDWTWDLFNRKALALPSELPCFGTVTVHIRFMRKKCGQWQRIYSSYLTKNLSTFFSILKSRLTLRTHFNYVKLASKTFWEKREQENY